MTSTDREPGTRRQTAGLLLAGVACVTAALACAAMLFLGMQVRVNSDRAGAAQTRVDRLENQVGTLQDDLGSLSADNERLRSLLLQVGVDPGPPVVVQNRVETQPSGGGEPSPAPSSSPRAPRSPSPSRSPAPRSPSPTPRPSPCVSAPVVGRRCLP